MTQETYISDSLIPAKYVQLAGSMAVGGMQTRNFDCVRDVCTMHLHAETGGVFVQRGEDHFYIAPIAVQSVDLIGAVSRADRADLATPLDTSRSLRGIPPKDTKSSEQMGSSSEAVAKGARNLADEVLAELDGAGRFSSARAEGASEKLSKARRKKN